MAEGNGLLNRHTLLRRIEGSNPSVSAINVRKFRFVLFLHASKLGFSALHAIAPDFRMQ